MIVLGRLECYNLYLSQLLPDLRRYQAPGDSQGFELVAGGGRKESGPLDVMRSHEVDSILVGREKIYSELEQGFRGLPLVVCPRLKLGRLKIRSSRTSRIGRVDLC